MEAKVEKSIKIHENLKDLLDSTKDNLKLEAMKQIMEMIAEGKDVSKLFPSVVKNVVSKNVEMRKLVYMYIIRYGENQQDLILLAISSLQRALKEPNQLLRANALKVLSSIKVKMIVPIILLAIKDASSDLSAFVRKTTAYAITKLYELDADQKPTLVLYIEKLLNDRTTLVVGPAIMAFLQVCPERIDLIHKVYKKLCGIIVDVDEWSQVLIINLLTRYARTQFCDPNKNMDNSEKAGGDVSNILLLNSDHRLLLKSVRPLLQSQNASVVVAVVQLYYYTAPTVELDVISKALIRLLRSRVEIQSIVLDILVSIIQKDQQLFEPYLKSFFVRRSDSTRVKLMKLDILTCISNKNNISSILREMKTYLSNSDTEFVTYTIKAIGKCACSISDVIEICLNGLLLLLSNKNEIVVAETVIVIKDLIRFKSKTPYKIVKQLAKLFDDIQNSNARSTIVWLVYEYSDHLSQIAPDILRKVAKNFTDESDEVKLQSLNLANKLHFGNEHKVKLLCEYIFNLAKYDKNYDIRDKARFLRYFYHDKKETFLTVNRESIFFNKKSINELSFKIKDKTHLQIGSLSHYINTTATGYQELPSFSKIVINTSLREPPQTPKIITSSVENTSNENTSTSDLNESDEEFPTILYDQKSLSSISISSAKDTKEIIETIQINKDNCESHFLIDTGESFTKYIENHEVLTPAIKKCDYDLLLDFDDTIPINTPTMTPCKSLTSDKTCPNGNLQHQITTKYISHYRHSDKIITLLDRVTGKGLGITCKFNRNPHLFSTRMVSITLTLTNSIAEDITNINISSMSLAQGMETNDFIPIDKLSPSCSLPGIIGIDFNDTIQTAKLDISSSLGISTIHIKPPIGELIRPIQLYGEDFIKEQSKLGGMNEQIMCITSDKSFNLVNEILGLMNVGIIPSSLDHIYWFAGETLASSSLLLVTINVVDKEYKITVNCEKIVVGSLLINDIKNIFK